MSFIIDKYIKNNGNYNYAYVVMILNENIYANPGIVFAESLKKVGCLCDIIALVNEKINKETITLLKNFYTKIIKIKTIEINHKNSIQNIILSKINAFKMIEYEKIFLIDVDTIIFTNPDNFFLKDTETQINKDSNIIYMPDIKNYGFILLKPSDNIYKKFLELILKHKQELKIHPKPLELLFNLVFKNDNIKKLNYKISYDSYSNVDCIQYRKDKPFLMTSNLTIEKRQQLDHFKVWFSYIINIINRYQEIKEYECVKETIQISKYFLASLSRFIVEFVKSNKNNDVLNVTNIYGSNNYKNLHYYHLDLTKEYTNKFIKYNTDTYDIKSFLEYLDLEINKNTKKFINYYNFTSTKLLIEKLDNEDMVLLYIFLNNYIKMFPNIFVVLEISTQKNNQNDCLDLKNNLVYRKTMNIKNKITKNIIFNLYQNFTYNQRIMYITKLLDKPNYNITLSIYELYSSINENDKNSNLDLFIFYEQSSKIRISSIFFNPNTIDQINLNTQCYNIFNDELKINCLSLEKLTLITYLQTLKKYIYSVYSGDEINNLGLYLESFNKIILIDNNKHPISKIKNINRNKIFFISIIFSNSSQYKDIIKEKNINVTSIYDLDKYWEFEGIKFLKKMNN